MNLADRLRRALGPDTVFEGAENVIVYEYDYGLDRGMPDLVVLPRTTAEVQVVVREAQAAQVPIVARGAGTGISGGAVPNTGGLVIEATVRLLPLPEAVRTTLALFGSVEQASEAVSGLIGGGMVPSALEMMDRLALSAIEAAFHAGYPPEAGAVLLVEVDGLLEQVEAQAAVVDAVCHTAGALDIRLARTADERARLWAARKGAASAMGRLAPD